MTEEVAAKPKRTRKAKKKLYKVIVGDAAPKVYESTTAAKIMAAVSPKIIIKALTPAEAYALGGVPEADREVTVIG